MQPLPGYPQGPQNNNAGPQQYPQGPQPPYQQGPQQYGGPQYPYYPQQKKGMPGWAIALIVCAGGFILLVLALAAIPFITSNSRDARRAEGTQIMSAARDYLRVEYSKSGDQPTAFQAFARESQTGAFRGQYYSVDPTAKLSNYRAYEAEIGCTPTTQTDGRGHMYFRWADASSETKWD